MDPIRNLATDACAPHLQTMSAFPPVSRYPSMFFGASCYGCSHRAFVSFAELIEAGHGDVPYDRAKAALKCSKCGSKKLAVTLHGVGVRAPEA